MSLPRLRKALLTIALFCGLSAVGAAPLSAGSGDAADPGGPSGAAAALLATVAQAEAGDKEAQYRLARIFHKGVGVRRDLVEALQLYELSAQQGYLPAQMELAALYWLEPELSRDPENAYFWFSLAASGAPPGEHRAHAAKGRDTVGTQLTRDQISLLLERAMVWQPKETALNKSSSERILSKLVAAPDLEDGNCDRAESAERLQGLCATKIAEGEPAAASVAPETEAEEPKLVAASNKMPSDTAAAEGQVDVEATAVAAATEEIPTTDGAAEPIASSASIASIASGASGTSSASIASSASSAPLEGEAAPPEAVLPEAVSEDHVSPTQQTAYVAAPPQELGRNFFVQVASLKTMTDAKSEWSKIRKRQNPLLRQHRVNFRPVDLESRGAFVRVLIGPFAERSSAKALCESLKVSNQDCLVVQY